MALKAIHDKQDEIEEVYRSLYSERDGKWELTGISGIKTQADVDRVQEGARKEREDHKETKAKLAAFDGLEAEDVHTKLDRIGELEAAAADKIDEGKLEEMAEARAKTRLAPVERENARLKKENEELATANSDLEGKGNTRLIHDDLRKHAKGIIPEAMEDVLMNGDRVFEVTAEGQILTKDGMGVTPGVTADIYFQEMQPKRPHWWPASEGGGSKGSGNQGGMPDNPWSKQHWNVTRQGQVYTEQGSEKAAQLAKLAGVEIGATHPAEKTA